MEIEKERVDFFGLKSSFAFKIVDNQRF